jgi:hypothetical protein
LSTVTTLQVVETPLEAQSPYLLQSNLLACPEKQIVNLDNGLKRGWIGTNQCALCKEAEESISDLFVSCPYAGKVMASIKANLGDFSVMVQ